jgi:hypothetical protein
MPDVFRCLRICDVCFVYPRLLLLFCGRGKDISGKARSFIQQWMKVSEELRLLPNFLICFHLFCLQYSTLDVGTVILTFIGDDQCCSHGGRRWAGLPSTDNFRPALQLKNRLPIPQLVPMVGLVLHNGHQPVRQLNIFCD